VMLMFFLSSQKERGGIGSKGAETVAVSLALNRTLKMLRIASRFSPFALCLVAVGDVVDIS
jgi:hypothetical protein